MAAEVEQFGLAGVTVDSDYQLTVEDAAAVAQHDVVVFADAATAGPEPFCFERIEPQPALSFSSHSVEPPAVLALAKHTGQLRLHRLVRSIFARHGPD